MIIRGLFIYICVCCPLLAYEQLYDSKWVAGDTPLSFISFGSDSVTIDSIANYNLTFTLTTANICDENGALLYITNGVYIYDKNGDTLQNGKGISPCAYTEQYICCGLNIPQAALFVPQPGNNQYYYLFHFTNDDTINGGPETMYYSVIDKEVNNGLGGVTKKNIKLLSHTPFREGGMTACKHANGRDYWLIIGGNVVNVFYKFLVTPDSIFGPYTQNIGPQFPLPFDNAYSRFSNDGSKYVTGVYEGPILVMDFDRCSGEFSNPITIYNQSCPNGPSCSGSSSVEISPDNRFVYVGDVDQLTQYDLLAGNIQDSVQLYTIDSVQIAQMNMLQLAPNGKIYLSSWDGLATYDSLHVINNPNALGDSCDFKFASQPTYSHNNHMPNMVNYSLGPLLGSGCDTLTGINNDAEAENINIRVYPNPAKQIINLAFKANTTGVVEFDLIDQLGETVMKELLGSQTYTQFGTGSLSNSLYYWVLKDSERMIKTGKVVIMK